MLFHEAWKDMYNHVVHEWTILYIETSDFLFVITKIPDIQTPWNFKQVLHLIPIHLYHFSFVLRQYNDFSNSLHSDRHPLIRIQSPASQISTKSSLIKQLNIIMLSFLISENQ